MQTKAQKALYWQLEQIAEPAAKANSGQLKEWLTGIWKFLASTTTVMNEPQVWCSKDWFGNTWWNIYLPKTGYTVRLFSEAEVRIWLEENLPFL